MLFDKVSLLARSPGMFSFMVSEKCWNTEIVYDKHDFSALFGQIWQKKTKWSS